MRATRGVPMTDTTTLDVSQYARLWRGVWWAQHLSMLLALVVGSFLLGVSTLYLTGGLETLANAWIRDIMAQGIDAAKQDDALMNIAALYWIARGVIRNTPATVASIIAASAVVIATYALGCRTFRLRLMPVHLIALAVLTVVFGIAVAQMVRAGVLTPEYDPAGGRVEKFADQILAAMCVVVLLLALVFLTVQGGLAWRTSASSLAAGPRADASHDPLFRPQSGDPALSNAEPGWRSNPSRAARRPWRAGVVVLGVGWPDARAWTVRPVGAADLAGIFPHADGVQSLHRGDCGS